MRTTRLYQLVNPSDMITFRATVAEAACIDARMRAGLYFVNDMETGAAPDVEDLQAEYDAIWKSAEKIASYAAAYRSFLIGSREEREEFERKTASMSTEDAVAFRESYHKRRRTSMNDICRQVWDNADRIAAYPPETDDAA